MHLYEQKYLGQTYQEQMGRNINPEEQANWLKKISGGESIGDVTSEIGQSNESILNQIYQNNDIWMTYGQYIHFPSGELGGHYHLHLDSQVDASNSYRHHTFPYSHLKTYKAFLLDCLLSIIRLRKPIHNTYVQKCLLIL